MQNEQRPKLLSDRSTDDLTDTVERRLSERRPPLVEPTFVWVSVDRRIQGRLIDESDSGIGVFVTEIDPLLQIGFQVRVELGETRRTASVVYIKQEPEGYRLGLEWE